MMSVGDIVKGRSWAIKTEQLGIIIALMDHEHEFDDGGGSYITTTYLIQWSSGCQSWEPEDALTLCIHEPNVKEKI